MGQRGGEAGVVPGRESGHIGPGARRTFIVSLVQDEAGRMSGIVELVRTGRKERFQGLDAMGSVIREMLAGGVQHGGGP